MNTEAFLICLQIHHEGAMDAARLLNARLRVECTSHGIDPVSVVEQHYKENPKRNAARHIQHRDQQREHMRDVRYMSRLQKAA